MNKNVNTYCQNFCTEVCELSNKDTACTVCVNQCVLFFGGLFRRGRQEGWGSSDGGGVGGCLY